MFTAVLALLFAGSIDPVLLDRPASEPPFVGIAACEEWKAQEMRRIARAVSTMKRKQRPEDWAISCVPIGPVVDG